MSLICKYWKWPTTYPTPSQTKWWLIARHSFRWTATFFYNRAFDWSIIAWRNDHGGYIIVVKIKPVYLFLQQQRNWTVVERVNMFPYSNIIHVFFLKLSIFRPFLKIRYLIFSLSKQCIVHSNEIFKHFSAKKNCLIKIRYLCYWHFNSLGVWSRKYVTEKQKSTIQKSVLIFWVFWIPVYPCNIYLHDYRV